MDDKGKNIEKEKNSIRKIIPELILKRKEAANKTFEDINPILNALREGYTIAIIDIIIIQNIISSNVILLPYLDTLNIKSVASLY